MSREGLKPAERELSSKQPNQWKGNPKQLLFMEYYMNPESPSFSNAYQSAKRAGYSEEYSKDILYEAPEWLREYKGLSNMKIEHIEQSLIKLASFDRESDAKSPDDMRIKALELLSKLKGYMIEKKQVASVVRVELGKVNTDISDK
jgi:hypothetical protein